MEIDAREKKYPEVGKLNIIAIVTSSYYLLFSSIILFAVLGCSQSNEQNQTIPSVSIEHLNEEELGPHEVSEALKPQHSNLVQQIIANAKPRQDNIDSIYYNLKDTIPIAFRKDNLFGLMPGPHYDTRLPDETWPCYFWNDYYELDSVLYFSFTRIEESCCLILYGVTVDKNKARILDITMLGLHGGDGGWIESDYGKWINDSTVNIVSPEYYNELVADANGYSTVHFDTTWVTINFDSKGKFRRQILDTVSFSTLEQLEY